MKEKNASTVCGYQAWDVGGPQPVLTAPPPLQVGPPLTMVKANKSTQGEILHILKTQKQNNPQLLTKIRYQAK